MVGCYIIRKSSFNYCRYVPPEVYFKFYSAVILYDKLNDVEVNKGKRRRCLLLLAPARNSFSSMPVFHSGLHYMHIYMFMNRNMNNDTDIDMDMMDMGMAWAWTWAWAWAWAWAWTWTWT